MHIFSCIYFHFMNLTPQKTKIKQKYLTFKSSLGQIWWYNPVIPALGRFRQEVIKFQTKWGYIVRFLSQNRTQQNEKLQTRWMFNWFIVFVYVCEYVHTEVRTVCRRQFSLAFSDLSSGERPQVIRLGSQHLNLLSHAGLASP